MSQHYDLMTLRVRASGAVASRRFVGFNGAQSAAAGAKALGVAQHAATDGQDIAVTVCGTAIVESGGVIALGQTVGTDTQGRAISGNPLTLNAGGTAVTSTAANGAIFSGTDLPGFAMGDALTAATAAGQFIEILLRR